MERITVVKIGGNVIDNPAAMKRFLKEFAALEGPKILVHGGGKLATRLAESGQRRLASGGRTVALAGAPPASRIVVSVFDSLEQAQAAYSSPAYLAARSVGDRYGRLRIFAVEGLPQ